MTARQEAIRKEFAEAEEAKQNANYAEAEFKAQIADARKEAARIREGRVRRAPRSSPRCASRRRSRRAAILEHAQAQIAAERQQALTTLRAEVGTLATSLAGRIVGESLEDDERSARVVDRFLADLESLEVSKTARDGASS